MKRRRGWRKRRTRGMRGGGMGKVDKRMEERRTREMCGGGR
jgi:hypothetical protein